MRHFPGLGILPKMPNAAFEAQSRSLPFEIKASLFIYSDNLHLLLLVFVGFQN
jgi:hypothetical protein